MELNINYDELEKMSLERAKEIIEKMDYEESLEDITETVDGINYGFDIIDDGDWDDQGKYQFKSEIGILCEFDKDYKIIKRFNVAAISNITRTGSYYTDYDYQYDNLEVKQIIQKYIPKQIIPEKIIVTLAK